MKLKQALNSFGVKSVDIEKVFKTALRNGGVLAELFFENTASTRVIFEGGRLDRVTDGIDRGVGLRILFDGRSVYGYTTELTEISLLRLAETLSEAVIGKKGSSKSNSAKEIEWQTARQSHKSIADYKELGKMAAQRVGVLLGAKPAPSGTMPVVLASEAGGTMIHEAVGHGLEADLACNGLSVYEGKLGQKVASPLITVMDDGTLAGKRGSYSFDDEGTPAQPSTLIEQGVLKSYMVDRLSALKFDLMATGNGRRESFRHKPIVRMTNTYIAPGKDDPEKILKDTDWGVFVKAMGGGQVNTVTGDFVFAVTEGYLIRNGKLAEPIRGATLVGNGPKVLSIVDRVGNDLGFSTGTCGKDGQGAPVTDAQPTLRIPELTVGGEVPVGTYWKKDSAGN
ncbi:MAG: TldD/PmbA family protein [Bdellovibrio sp.]|nr:TldD/PmbA family protein [Bdellovibrio sp.]